MEGISFSRLRVSITTSITRIRETTNFGTSGAIWWTKLQKSFSSLVFKPIKLRATIKTNLSQRSVSQKCNCTSVGAGTMFKRQLTTCRSFTITFYQGQLQARPKSNPSSLSNKKSQTSQAHCQILSRDNWSWCFTDTSATWSRSKTGSRFKWGSECRAMKCLFNRKRIRPNFHGRSLLTSLKRNMRRRFSQSKCSNIKSSKPLKINLLKNKVRKFASTRSIPASFWPNSIITTWQHFTHSWSAKKDGFSTIIKSRTRTLSKGTTLHWNGSSSRKIQFPRLS